MATRRERNAIKKKNEQLRRSLWKDVDDDQLWLRGDNKGYVTIPASMTLIQRIMDEMCVGKPVSATYFALWCNAWDSPMVEIRDERPVAFESGFTGQRAIATWRQRMKKLVELGFIKTVSGQYGDFNYVLIMNPHQVIMGLVDSKKIQPHGYYAALIERANLRGFAKEFE